MKEIKVKITTTEGLLGTSPANKEVYSTYIAANAPDSKTIEEEIAEFGVDAVTEKGTTIFPRMEDGTPFLYDYQIKGFFKDACGGLARIGGKGEDGKKRAVNESGKLKAYKKLIDTLIFPEPRKIPIRFDGEVGYCERPLRAMTMQGERVSLAKSEEIPAGAVIEFTVKLLDESLLPALIEWLDYGALRGLGQWRNSGKGRFTYEIAE